MVYYEIPGLQFGSTINLGAFIPLEGEPTTAIDIRQIVASGNFFYVCGRFGGYINPDGTSRISPYLIKINKQTGMADSTFTTLSAGVSLNAGATTYIYSVAVSGSDVYIGGEFTSYRGTTRQRVAKISATNGALDGTFDAASGFNSTVYSLVLDGTDLYCGGNFTTYKSTTRQYVAKIATSNAALDATFDAASGANLTVFNLIKDGSNLFIGGSFTSYKATTRQRVAKINASTAALDTTFDAASGANLTVQSLVVDSSDLYIGGVFTTYKGTNRERVVKVSASTAALDATFDAASGANSTVFNLIKDGSDLFICGSFTTYKGSTRNGIAKISASTAALDGTFLSANATGTALYTLLKDGISIYVGGTFVFYNNWEYIGMLRVSPTSGAPINVEQFEKNWYNVTGAISTNLSTQVRTVLAPGDGYVYVGGGFDRYVSPSGKITTCKGIAKISTTTKEFDSAFNGGTGFNDVVEVIIKDGSNLYVGGYFTSYDGTTRQRVAKISASTGAVDATFDTASGFNSYVEALVIDGTDLYVGGNFTTYKTTNTRQYVAKINASTAAIDATFDSASGANSTVISMIKDGSNLFIGGAFTSYKATTRQRIAKISASTAALDATFDAASGASSNVNSIVLDGANIIIGGNFSTYKGTNRAAVAKVSASTAALDATFDAATGFDAAVFVMTIDGSSLYVGGLFTNYKSTSRPYLAKLSTSTAALDTTFIANGSVSAAVRGLSVDGSTLYVGGAFQTFRGTLKQKVASLTLTDGYDSGF